MHADYIFVEEETQSVMRPAAKTYIAAIATAGVVAAVIELLHVHHFGSHRVVVFCLLVGLAILAQNVPAYVVHTKSGELTGFLEGAVLIPLMLVFNPFLIVPVAGLADLVYQIVLRRWKRNHWDLVYNVGRELLVTAAVALFVEYGRNHFDLWVTLTLGCILYTYGTGFLEVCFAQFQDNAGRVFFHALILPAAIATQAVEICVAFFVYALVQNQPLSLLPALILLVAVQFVLRRQSSSASEEKRLDALFNVGLEAQQCHTTDQVETLICERSAQLLGAQQVRILDHQPDDDSLSVPIASQRRRWLVVSSRGRPFRHFDQQLLQGLALIMSQALQATTLMRELEHQALSDSLTGLANRRAFTDGLTKALARRERAENMIVVCYLDLDFFKEINDTHGHDAGDAVLAEFANRLRKSVRTGDLVARLGGDEFAIAALDVNELHAITEIPEKILAMSQTPVRLPNGTEIVIKPSIGVAAAPQDGATAEALVAAADGELYNAKRNGRGNYSLSTAINQLLV